MGNAGRAHRALACASTKGQVLAGDTLTERGLGQPCCASARHKAKGGRCTLPWGHVSGATAAWTLCSTRPLFSQLLRAACAVAARKTSHGAYISAADDSGCSAPAPAASGAAVSGSSSRCRFLSWRCTI